MQSWPPNQGGEGNNNSWQQPYDFATPTDQFDHGQTWQQSVPGQDPYRGQLNPSDPNANFLPDPHSMLSGYHNEHDAFELGQQFSNQEAIDPAFSNIHPDLYAQQNKMDLDGVSMHHQLNQIQGHSHAHAQAFPHHSYGSYDPPQQDGQQFGSATAASQYTQAHLMPQDPRQHNHTPVQQFNNIQPPNYSQTQLQQSRTPPVQHQQPYGQTSDFAPPPTNGQPQQFQANTNQNVDYHQNPSAAYPSQQYKSFEYQQSPEDHSKQPYLPATQQQQQQQFDPRVVQHHSAPRPQDDTPPQLPTSYEEQIQPPQPEGPAKKRQRVAGAVAASPIPEPSLSVAHSPVDSSSKRMDELDSLVAPTPSPEDVQKIQQFQKRSQAAQAKFPSIKGAPHLVHEDTIKLPAPKSYDKLAPLVAVPSRSKKAILPETGHDLPCEVQGRFTSHYRPAYDKTGLDERRLEAKPLLDEFDSSMKALGKKRPKYTEYPHSFKEQLKSDEASKNKAEKKAKKEQEEERKPIRSQTRPTDPVEAAAWDAIGIVHIEPSVSKTSSLVAGCVQQAGDLFIKLRSEMNQAKQELDQATKEKKPEPEIMSLRHEADIRKSALHRALDATIEHADDAVIDNLGGHQKLVLSLNNVLISCIKAADFSGKLPKIVLELFTHFPMTKKIAETPNFDTVRRRLADKGDDEIKDLVREISAKVKKVLKADETSTGYTGTSAASRAKTAGSKPGSLTSTKRGRDDDPSADGRTIKKVAVESGSGSLSKKLAQPKIQLQSASKTTAAKAAASSVLGEKGRPTPKTMPKPEPSVSVDSPSGSADEKPRVDAKKPGSRPEAAKIAPSRSDAKPPAPKMGAAPTSSALSGIASLLDSINTGPRAKTPPPVIKDSTDPDTPETETQRAKRLRKESRRKLRVSWKPENELVQVKIFEKEDHEDEGRDMNMIRDAADDKSEGMVLKQRANVEEDDDDDDVPYQPWLSPSEMDFSPLPEETRNKNYKTRGGNVEFSTDEQHNIAQREQRELMAIYSDVDDIPPTPKSPQFEAWTPADSKVGELPREGPKFEEIQVRWREEQQMGVDGALYSATQRLTSKSNPSNMLDSIFGRLQGTVAPSHSSAQHASHTPSVTSGNDVNVPLALGAPVAEQVLSWLRSDQIKRWTDPHPIHIDPNRVYHFSDPHVQAAAAIVEPVSRDLAGKPYPATDPPEWLARDDERVREWWQVYNKEYPLRQKRIEEERLKAAASVTAAQGQAGAQDWLAYYAQIQQQQQQQQQPLDPYMAILQQINGGQGQTNQQQQQPGPAASRGSQAPDNQLQSILAAMGQGQQLQSQAQAQTAAGYHPNDPSYQQLMMLTQMAQGQAPQAAQGGDQDHEWDRDGQWDRQHDRNNQDRYDNHDDYRNRDHYDRGHKDRDRDKKKQKPGPSTIHKPPNAALIGTKPCTFWQQGKCARGDKCTFRHD